MFKYPPLLLVLHSLDTQVSRTLLPRKHCPLVMFVLLSCFHHWLLIMIYDLHLFCASPVCQCFCYSRAPKASIIAQVLSDLSRVKLNFAFLEQALCFLFFSLSLFCPFRKKCLIGTYHVCVLGGARHDGGSPWFPFKFGSINFFGSQPPLIFVTCSTI